MLSIPISRSERFSHGRSASNANSIRIRFLKFVTSATAEKLCGASSISTNSISLRTVCSQSGRLHKETCLPTSRRIVASPASRQLEVSQGLLPDARRTLRTLDQAREHHRCRSLLDTSRDCRERLLPIPQTTRTPTSEAAPT